MTSWGDHASLSRVSMPRLNWFFVLVCVGNFDERIVSSSSWQEVHSRVTQVRSDWKRLLVAAKHTHVAWFGWKCPSCWDWVTRLSSLQKGEILLVNCLQAAECVNSQAPSVSAQAHFMECCSPREKAFWCVLSIATILWTVNSVLNTSTTCHVCMLLSLCVLNLLCT